MSQTVVVLLNARGPQELYCGWRVEELFRGKWDASPSDIADATGLELGMPMQVHALIHDDEVRHVVLRWSTAYSSAPRAAVRAEAVFARQSPGQRRRWSMFSLVRFDDLEGVQPTPDEEACEQRPTSGTFPSEARSRVTMLDPLSAYGAHGTKTRYG